MIAVAVKTIDRTPAGVPNYLGQTLENLWRAGVFDSQLLSSFNILDGGSPDPGEFSRVEILPHIPPYVGLGYCTSDQPRTLHQNAQQAIEWAAGDMHADWVLVLEDDIDVVDQFLESAHSWLCDHARPEHLMYALGANYSQIVECVQRGFTGWKYPVGAFYGAQALAWRRADAAQLAEWLGPDPHCGGVRNHGHDLLLQEWGRSRGVEKFLASAPSMVQHVGGQSGIGNRMFTFPSWPGRDWRYAPAAACAGVPAEASL